MPHKSPEQRKTGRCMGVERFRKRVVVLEILSFALVITALWMDDFLNIAHKLFGAASAPFNLTECLGETLVTFLIGSIVVYLTYASSSASKEREERVFQVCSACKKVNREGVWIPLDDFISENTPGVLKHGICPDCMDSYYKGVTNTTALNYKQFLKYRKPG